MDIGRGDHWHHRRHNDLGVVMYSTWTKNIKGTEEQEQYRTNLLRARWVLEDLSKILDSMKQEIDRQEISPRVYDKLNWDVRQAHTNGFKQCLSTVMRLINLDQKDNITNDREQSVPNTG
jgi:hypothetical protein